LRDALWAALQWARIYQGLMAEFCSNSGRSLIEIQDARRGVVELAIARDCKPMFGDLAGRCRPVGCNLVL
jgi:hypothetical protein